MILDFSKHADPVTAYCRAGIIGEFPAGEAALYAMERHLRDLRDGPGRGLFWRPARARKVIDFFPTMLMITGGNHANKPFKLLPYTMFMTGSWAGWHTAEGLLRFRTIYAETAKGQGKSPWLAAMGLYLFRFMNVPRAEVYAIAGTKEQANVLFKDATAMVGAEVPDTCLLDQYGNPIPGTGQTLLDFAGLKTSGIGDNTWKIEFDGSDFGLGTSVFRSIASGDTISGPRPVGAVVDEVHEHKTNDAIELWSQALVKQPGNSLMLMGTNTPAADQRVGISYSDFYTAIAKGEFREDSSLAYIASVDPDDKPTEYLDDETEQQRDAREYNFRKALPALGYTFALSAIRTELGKAQHMPAKMQVVRRLYFGERVGVAAPWIDWPAWESCQRPFDEALMRKHKLQLVMGLDLSSRKDMTALALVWRDRKNALGRGKDHLFVTIRYWTPAATMHARAKEDLADYPLWVEQGHLIAVPGPVISKAYIAGAVKTLDSAHDTRLLAFDPAQIIDFEAAADDIALRCWRYMGPKAPVGRGLKMVLHSQGFRGMNTEGALWMPRSVERTEDAVLNRNISVQPNPVTTFCSQSMTLNNDGANNRTPDRKTSRGRIDGIVAMIQAVGGTFMDDAELSLSGMFSSPAVMS